MWSIDSSTPRVSSRDVFRLAGSNVLTRGSRPAGPSLLAIVPAFVLTTMGPSTARGASDADAPDRPATLSAHTTASGDGPAGVIEDTSTKHAVLEMAAYDDTDGVTVFTPSVALGIENVSGAALHASYLVDVVSAAWKSNV